MANGVSREESTFQGGVYKRLQTRLEGVWGRRDLTQPISFRIPLYIKIIYDSLEPEVKRRIKLALEQVILAMAGLEVPPQPGQPVIINMNINVNENKPQVNVNIDISKLVDLVSRLYELRKPLPPLQRELVEKLYSLVRKGVN